VRLSKPFSGSILLARINSLLESRERLKNSLTKKQDAVNNITKDSSLLDQATTKILANISDADFGVQALADALFMSRSKLHRQLKSQNQINASDLLRSIRMKKADELLRNNSGNVSEVCCAVGYTSVSSFSNSYKDTFGISPSSR
jgi:AraC-like DNA-binding protein